MSEILINPDQVEQNADGMNNLVKQLKQKIEEVNSIAKSLKEVWQDNAQESFEGDFVKLSQNFESLADFIPEYIAQAYKHADLMRRTGKIG